MLNSWSWHNDMHLVLQESETRGIVVLDSAAWMSLASELARSTILPIRVSGAIFHLISYSAPRCSPGACNHGKDKLYLWSEFKDLALG